MRRPAPLPVLVLVALASCGSPQPDPDDASMATSRQACRGTPWGIAAYDGLYALDNDSAQAWVFAENPRRGVDLTAAKSRLQAALQQDPGVLQIRPRVILQHDIWGLHERLIAGTSSDPEVDALARVAAQLERKLALPARSIPSSRTMPADVRARLPKTLGWREVASEMPVLSHESAFGLRRIFRVAQRDGEVALFSQLVVRDDRGRARQAAIAGELEVLTMRDDEVVGARVFELDRRAVACGESEVLAAVEVVSTVPVHGADRYFGRFERPMRVDELPCLQCHHDPHMGSLPTDALDPSWRWEALLQQVGGERVAG